MEQVNTGWHKLLKPLNAPTFRLPNVYLGKHLTSVEVFTTTTVLTFLPGIWAPWSRKFLESLNQQSTENKSGYQYVAVISQLYEELIDYISEKNLTIPILCDQHGTISKRYGIFDDTITEPMKISRPAIFIIDSEQRIQYKFIGRHLTDQPNSEDIAILAQHIHSQKQHKRRFNLFNRQKLAYAT